MRKFASIVITLISSALWLIGTYFVSFVVFGEGRGLQQFIGGVIIAGFGAMILWYGSAINRAAAVYVLSLVVLLAVLAIVSIVVHGSKNLVENLEFVFVGVVTALLLWAWRVSWKREKNPPSIGS